MNSRSARTVANVLLVAAGVAAAYGVIAKPRFRRLALRAIRLWLGASVPIYLVTEARQAWMESGRAA